MTISKPDQLAALTFTGTAGQRVAFKVGHSLAFSCVQATVVVPDGSVLGGYCVSGSRDGAFGDVLTLPTAGSYKLLLNPYFADTGAISVRTFNVPADKAVTTSIGAAPVTIATTVPGQNSSVSFAGTAGQRLSIAIAHPWTSCGAAYLTVLKPDGGRLTIQYTDSTSPARLSDLLLPATGTYRVIIDPLAGRVGSATVTLALGTAIAPASLTTAGPASGQLVTRARVMPAWTSASAAPPVSTPRRRRIAAPPRGPPRRRRRRRQSPPPHRRSRRRSSPRHRRRRLRSPLTPRSHLACVVTMTRPGPWLGGGHRNARDVPVACRRPNLARRPSRVRWPMSMERPFRA